MKTTKLFVIVAAIAVIATAAPIDFSTWTSANGQAAYSVGNTTLTAQFPPNSLLSITSAGAGVNRPGRDEKDEVDFPELLEISFSVPVTLNSITFQKIYGIFGLGEELYFRIDGGPRVAVNGNLSGTVVVGVNQTHVNSIVVTARHDSISDGAVRSIDASAVPEPSTLLLGGSVLLLGVVRRKINP